MNDFEWIEDIVVSEDDAVFYDILMEIDNIIPERITPSKLKKICRNHLEEFKNCLEDLKSDDPKFVNRPNVVSLRNRITRLLEVRWEHHLKSSLKKLKKFVQEEIEYMESPEFSGYHARFHEGWGEEKHTRVFDSFTFWYNNDNSWKESTRPPRREFGHHQY